MTTIYIVEGSTGEYSDRREWPVMAYRNEEQAKAHVLKAQEWANQQRYDHGRVREDPRNPHDPGFQLDYTGTTYYYYAIELVEDKE